MRNILKKILKAIVLLFTGLVLFLLGVVLFVFGKQKIEEIQAHRAIPELRAEMQPLSADHIPGNVTVLAIGEGVHGSSEFQTLKLSVLREMVEKQGYTALRSKRITVSVQTSTAICRAVRESRKSWYRSSLSRFITPKRWQHCLAGYRIGTGQHRMRKRFAFTALICRIPRPAMRF